MGAGAYVYARLRQPRSRIAAGYRLGVRGAEVEPERVPADLDQVAIGQDALGLNPLTVDVGAVQAAVHQQEALRGAEEVGVAPGDLFAVNRNVGGRLSTDGQRCRPDEVSLPVRKANEAACACAHDDG